MLWRAGGRRLAGMTITFDTQTTTDHTTDVAAVSQPIVLDGGLFFQPSPVVEQARRLASEGVEVTVSMSLGVLDHAPVTGTSRRLLEAGVENRLRAALYAAGYRIVTRRRDVPGAIVLDASS
jgi:hypothetical protein